MPKPMIPKSIKALLGGLLSLTIVLSISYANNSSNQDTILLSISYANNSSNQDNGSQADAFGLKLCTGDVRKQPPFYFRAFDGAIQMLATSVAFPASSLRKPLGVTGLGIGLSLLMLGFRKTYLDVTFSPYYLLESWILFAIVAACIVICPLAARSCLKACGKADVMEAFIRKICPPPPSDDAPSDDDCCGICELCGLCVLLIWAIQVVFNLSVAIVISATLGFGFFYSFGIVFPSMRSTYLNYNCESLHWMCTPQLPSILQAIFLATGTIRAYDDALSWMRSQGKVELRVQAAEDLQKNTGIIFSSWHPVKIESPELHASVGEGVSKIKFQALEASRYTIGSGSITWDSPETWTFPVNRKVAELSTINLKLVNKGQTFHTWKLSVHNMLESEEWRKMTFTIEQTWAAPNSGSLKVSYRLKIEEDPAKFYKHFDMKRLAILVPWMAINVLYSPPLVMALFTHLIPGLFIFFPLTILAIVLFGSCWMPLVQCGMEKYSDFLRGNLFTKQGDYNALPYTMARRNADVDIKEDGIRTALDSFKFKAYAYPVLILVPFYSEAMVRFYAGQTWYQCIYYTWVERTIHSYIVYLQTLAHPWMVLVEGML